MIAFDYLQCAVVILLLFVAGEIVSTKTKAFVPSVFVVAILFLLGYWSGAIPTDIITTSGFSALGMSAMLVIVVHMGTMLSPAELMANWKTVVIALCSLVGLVGLLLVIGSRIIDWNTVIVAIPPLAGGMTAAIIMQNGAAARGYETLAVLAIVVYVVQGFVGYPLTAIMLKREARRLSGQYEGDRERWLEEKGVKDTSGHVTTKKRLIPPIPEKYQSVYTSLLAAYATVWISSRLELLTGGAVSKYVFCLVLGVAFSQLGLLESNCLNSAQSFGIFQTTAMSMVFAGLSSATPEMFKMILVPLILILIIGVSGLFIMSVLAGKLLHISWEMSFAIALNALYGFPPNMIITNEVIKNTTDDPQLRDYLTDHMMSKMLVGGFTSVTVTSTLLAGVFINFIR